MADTSLNAEIDQGLGGGLGTAEPSAADFFALLKPRVMSLVVFTGLVGLVVAPGSVHPVIGLTALLCIAIGAGASGAINMWFDADIDGRMDRTSKRPIPMGRITPNEALGFGATLAVGSVAAMELLVNAAAAVLLAVTIAYYVFIYTMWLKRRTPQNIVIGGAAGAFPPMIGWAAVTGGISLYPVILFAIIFFWTPPHFWALALYRSDDYARVGVPMLPVVSGLKETRRQILLYTAILVPLAMLPWMLGYAGWLYGAGSSLLGAAFVWFAAEVWRRRDVSSAKRLFGFSILYLFLIFALLAVDSLAGFAATARSMV